MRRADTHVNKRVVLVIEDDPRTRKLLAVTLEAKGYYVLEARDARTAASIAAHGMPISSSAARRPR
jgi:DNA-binding response OmpR family regulator